MRAPSDQLRVLFVTNGLAYGGAERIVEALALDLKAAGDEVAVVATTRGGPVAENLNRHGIRVHILGIRNPLDARVVWRLARVMRKFQPDIVHSHLAVADITTAMARPAVRARFVTTVHNPGVELDLLKKTLWMAALKNFDRVLPVGEHVRRSLGPLEQARVIRPSLVDLDAAVWTKARARQLLGIPEDVPLALGVGRLSRVKGFDVLASSLKHLRTKNVRVAVIGEGPEADALRASPIALLGGKDEAAELLAAADVVVSPSRSEGFPQVPLQAMAASRALVATRVGGTPEVIVDGATGILVEPEAPTLLANAIDAVLEDPGLAGELGRAGRQRLIDAELTRAAMVRATRAAYLALLG
ncbi:MAG: glycosyltransferase [Myxococcota bacterium]